MKIEFRELISNGYTLRGLFSKPESEYKDLVVMLHGFTGHKNENGYLFKQLTQTLTDNQIATLRYDFMGSGESDGNFEDFTFFTELEDAKHIIEEAFRLNNNRKIILLGFSMGPSCGGACALRSSAGRSTSPMRCCSPTASCTMKQPSWPLPCGIRPRKGKPAAGRPGGITAGQLPAP